MPEQELVVLQHELEIGPSMLMSRVSQCAALTDSLKVSCVRERERERARGRMKTDRQTDREALIQKTGAQNAQRLLKEEACAHVWAILVRLELV